jgi:hypothetical protein
MVAITSARGLEIDTNKGPLLLITFMLIRKYDKKKNTLYEKNSMGNPNSVLYIQRGDTTVGSLS